MIKLFSRRWDDAPTGWIDTETTGTRPGLHRAVSVAIVRFERGAPVGSYATLVDPGQPIPSEATAIHGITDERVSGMPTIEHVFALPAVQSLLRDAQPAAYNAPFDRHFVPPFGEDWTWPWADSLSIVRVVDRFERGKGRHKLAAAAARHGVPAWDAHQAEGDATAAGLLFYRLVPMVDGLARLSLGELLHWQRQQEANEWFRFMGWMSKQPRETGVAP
jgi:DNA polymerase-3 subunit epsilon